VGWRVVPHAEYQARENFASFTSAISKPARWHRRLGSNECTSPGSISSTAREMTSAQDLPEDPALALGADATVQVELNRKLCLGLRT
jgi:hypothetical protein